MNVFKKIISNGLPNTRTMFHNTRTRRTRPQISWRNDEAVASIEEELSKPYTPVIPENPPKRLSESNPANHTNQDVGKFYTLSEAVLNRYFVLGGIPRYFKMMTTAFTESCIMIRKPTLEIIEYMKQANYDKLPVKYLMYGPDKSGKSISLMHIIHYAATQDFIIFHVPKANNMFTSEDRKEAHRSEKNPDLIDLPLDAAYLLKHFELQNAPLIEKLDLKTTQEHVWNARESMPAGTSLLAFINFGINRVNYACECLDALICELKNYATNGKCKVLFALKGFNALYPSITPIEIDDQKILPDKLSLIQSYKKFLKPDWCNGAIVLTIGTDMDEYCHKEAWSPFYLLRREGFEDIDPFIPVHVPELTEHEFHSLLDYYEDRRWLQTTGGRDEIEFLSTRIAGEIAKFCAPY